MLIGQGGWHWQQEPGKRCQVLPQGSACISSLLGSCLRDKLDWGAVRCLKRKLVTEYGPSLSASLSHINSFCCFSHSVKY